MNFINLYLGEAVRWFGETVSYLRELNIWSMMLRIVFAMLLGGIVGIEREKKRRAAGFRTYMLVAVGAALTVMLGEYLAIMLSTAWCKPGEEPAKTDVVRFAAQVVNGVGFLGAGTILVTGRQEVKGLTTAAGLWASACMGIAIGAGFYECMLIGSLLIVVCMRILPGIEDIVISKSRNMNISLEMDTLENLGNIIGKIKSEGLKLYDVEIEKNVQKHITMFSVFVSVGLPKKVQHTEVLAMLSLLDGVVAIEES